MCVRARVYRNYLRTLERNLEEMSPEMNEGAEGAALRIRIEGARSQVDNALQEIEQAEADEVSFSLSLTHSL